MRAARKPSYQAAGAHVLAQMRHEHQLLRGSLHQSMQQGHSPDMAMHAALAQVDTQRDQWRELLAAIAIGAAIAASRNLVSTWQDAGYLPADYPAYDPSTDPASALRDYINTDAPTAADSIVDDTRATLFDLFKDTVSTPGADVQSLIDALDQQYATWGVPVNGQPPATPATDENVTPGSAEDATDVSGRAGVIANTSVTAPWSLGELDTATDVTASDNPDAPTDDSGTPLVAVKTWVCSMLPNSRAWHVDADGQQVALDATFSVGGEDLDGPGDGSPQNSRNCCCSQLIELAPATYALDSETGG